MFLACCALAIVMPEQEPGHRAAPPSAPTAPPGDDTILGKLHHARGPIHEMTRAELQDELSTRRVDHRTSDSDDQLRFRLHQARSALLDHRNEHMMHAERVLQEIDQNSAGAFLADSSLDTILADDNAVFADSLSRRLLGAMNMQAAGGTLLGLVLTRFQPLGVLERVHRLLPIRFSPSLVGYGSIALVTSALLGLLQAVTQGLRHAFDAQSFFGQKLAATTCREGIIEWIIESEEAATSSGAAALSGTAAALSGAATSGRPPKALTPLLPSTVLLRRRTILPILSMAAGSSILEETVFRGLFLHGLITRARLGPLLSATLSSAIFGISHIANERNAVQRAIYAVWTFFGGLVFGAAYLGTGGGLVLPVLLHFFNNAIVAAVCVQKVASRLEAGREEYRAMVKRLEHERAVSQAYPFVVLQDGAGGHA